MLARLAAASVLVLALAGCGGSETTTTTTTPARRFAVQHFVTRPDLRPPPIRVVTPAHDTAPGYLFVAPKKQVAQAGPMILDDRGRVVWFMPLDTKGVTDFKVQTYRGQPVLTWWRGQTAKGVGNGRYVIADSSYRVIANVRAGHGLSGDIHEFLITPRSTALFTVYRAIHRDLSALGGPKDELVNEGVIQEVDIATGKVLFEWHSADHVPLADSYEPLPKDPKETWDYFHENAIAEAPDGTLLLSARHTHAVYAIRKRDGKILWTLGGKHSDFTGPGTDFAWQHDIRVHADGTYSLFDNHASRPGDKATESRALVLRLDEGTKRATVVRSYAHTPPLLSTSQGNAQLLGNGDVLVGWGSKPVATEFAADGTVLLDLRIVGKKVDSYRWFRTPWIGHPVDPPVAVARRTGSGATVYASWNGATEVRRWRVSGDGVVLATVPKDGFETAIRVPGGHAAYAVDALGADGTVLGASALAPVGK
jgi:hypothetical protein